MLIQHKEFAAELAKIFAGAPSATVGYRPNGPARANGNYEAMWARQAHRYMTVYGKSQKTVHSLLTAARSPIKNVAAPLPAKVPAGFGGSGYSGAPPLTLGHAPTLGNTVAPPPPPAAPQIVTRPNS